MRFGIKPTYRRVWALIGQRPTTLSRARHEWCYVFASVHPETGTTHALILPVANTKAMQLYLDDFAASLPIDVVVLLVLDGTSWHRSPKLSLPDNLRLVFLPPYTPELNPAETSGPCCMRSPLTKPSRTYMRSRLAPPNAVSDSATSPIRSPAQPASTAISRRSALSRQYKSVLYHLIRCACRKSVARGAKRNLFQRRR